MLWAVRRRFSSSLPSHCGRASARRGNTAASRGLDESAAQQRRARQRGLRAPWRATGPVSTNLRSTLSSSACVDGYRGERPHGGGDCVVELPAEGAERLTRFPAKPSSAASMSIGGPVSIAGGAIGGGAICSAPPPPPPPPPRPPASPPPSASSASPPPPRQRRNMRRTANATRRSPDGRSPDGKRSHAFRRPPQTVYARGG